MRTLLLAWAFCTASLAAEGPAFSHKLHLQQKLECSTCHGKAVASTQASDNLLPAPEVCAKCHDRMAVPAPRAHNVQKFNHALHLKMGNLAPVIAKAIDTGAYLGAVPPGLRAGLNAKNACAACHRGMEQSVAVSGSAAMPRMADCLVCHNRIEPPYSCEKCHTQVKKLTPASHTQDWVDVHSSGTQKLDKQSCAVCHGRNFTCQGCH